MRQSAPVPWLWTLLWLGLAGPKPALDGPAINRQIDRLVADHVASSGVPGVVVAVTEGDRVVLARGWGVADVESGRPMDPDHTLVRIASLSKTFTATAVAQLEDEGQLDIDADVDDYLTRAKTAGAFSAPVTVRHLMAHTSGYINFNSGRVSKAPIHPEDFEGFIARTMPPRMHPPGTAVLYTNHGNALAGLVVQNITGVAFSDHVRRTILDPLEMKSTAYYVDAHQPELSRSYEIADDGSVNPWPYEYFATVPASAVHTTARDMASYLMLHATDGSVRGTQVLTPAALARMRTPSPTIHPALGEYHYTFAPTHVHGHAARAHGGSVPAFLSRMVIFDDAGVGVFVAQNAFGPNIASAVVNAVAEALPAADPPPALTPIGDGRPVNPSALVGEYRVLDKHETAAFTRARAVLTQPPLRIDLDDDGYLAIQGRRFERTGELVFQATAERGGVDSVVFVPGPDGAAAWVHHNRSSAFRPAWHQSRGVQIVAHGVALGMVLIGLLGAGGRGGGLWRTLAAAVLLGVIAPQAFAYFADAGQPVYTHPLRLGTPAWIPVVQWVPRVSVVLCFALLFYRQWRTGPGMLVACGGALLVALEAYWRAPPVGLL